MPIEFIGMIRCNDASEIDGAHALTVEDEIDPSFVRAFARAHEDAGFDRVLIGTHSTGPDPWAVGGYAAACTERLHMLIAQRPGFIAPTIAARAALTQDRLTGGRISLNIVSGASDADLLRDGDHTTKEERYRRTDEYLTIMRQVWASETPFDFDGEFYQVKNAFSDVRPVQPTIPIFFGGASGGAITVGAKHADVCMLWGEPLAAIQERIDSIRAAAPAGRSPGFSVSIRPIIGKTEAEAWDLAHHYLEMVKSHREGQNIPTATTAPAAGSQRLLEFADQSEIHDKRLWMAIAAATGAGGNSTALVGTAEQVADSILDYYDLGVKHILIRGFQPLEDVVEYGRELLPIVHDAVARRDRAAIA
ncbi:MAG: LLM class flavin-dependent oxidoreductase [Thermomicrobiales bacterium]